jgi:NAD(P)H-flavin reductase
MSEMTARILIVKSLREQGRDIRSFNALPAEARRTHGVSFVPGQVALLRAEGDTSPSYFAIASAPEDAELQFLVKRSNASQQLFDLHLGDRVEMTGIVGRGFPLGEHQGKDLVFVAMGTGVAPLRSALRHVLRRKSEFGEIVVLYGARTPDDFCYRDETESWEEAGVELRQVISRPDGHDWSGPTGYVQSLLDHILPNLSKPIALVCGSREMISQTRDRLQQLGFAPEEILTNY